ncbi:hypothetical protein HJC23_007949 [Cyclotella cryptica]|uniref:AAA+ ATPase domain-containing protein n=1 Tax=Cyclotella cryptica TaxID=29204 RepID=A0ABD3PBV9_9STRA|eukprot:CCRYP_016210-RA/>CCRYP_016210-RA protein AED:0.05 eAED:0.06 QI:0/0/0/1/1/1/2/0/800
MWKASLLSVMAAVASAPETLAFSTPKSALSFQSPSPHRSNSSTRASSPRLHRHPSPLTPTSLFSLKPLLDEIQSQISNKPNGQTPVIFVGGKGGVGKTSISSSLAVSLASSPEHDWKVLIVSTDPAHSLGDALDVDLRHPRSRPNNANDPVTRRPQPTLLTDPLTNGKLHALEVDPTAALQEFQSNLELFDISTLSQSMGIPVSASTLQELGLDELHTVLRNPPPGLDELVALSNVLDPEYAKEYDVIIVDTAPTGHTLRMLQLPQFLDGFLMTLLKLRERLRGLISTMQMFLGGGGESGGRGGGGGMNVDEALNKLEEFQHRTAELRERLKCPESTKFVVVTIPTILSVRESQRLIAELRGQGVCVSDVVVNQCIGGAESSSGDVSEAMKTYYDRRVAGQQRWITELKDACADVSKSEEYRSNAGQGGGTDRGIVVKEVPYYDVELVGVPALGFLGSMTFADESFRRLVGFEEEVDGPKVIICGGKGGVGKTTTSSSLAIAMAKAGHNVVLVSTDPAHSLGDALDMNLKGGSLIDVPLFGVPPIATAGSDDEGKNTNGADNSELFSTLSSVGDLLDTLPAGTDEVVALAKVIQIIRRGQFDRVVLDTAPTGHTLRMLTTPSFLADLIEKVLSVSRKLNSNAAVKMLLASAKSKYDVDDAAESAKSALLKFQVSMYDLEDLFADPASTEFLIVTIASELAVRESTRLLNDLTFGDPDMPIRVRSVVVNQVLEEDKIAQAFMSQVAKTQSSCIDEVRRSIESLRNAPRITEVSYLDTEPRGVYGLKALSEEYLAERKAAVP